MRWVAREELRAAGTSLVRSTPGTLRLAMRLRLNPQPLPQATDEARNILENFIASGKVTIVAMESCEFCWTIFKFLKADARRSVFAAARGPRDTSCHWAAA